jgi:acetyl-CoA carboxylase carboxyl transferase subunit beta
VAWFGRKKKPMKKSGEGRVKIPKGLFTNCKKCGQTVFAKDVEKNLGVCPKCGYHYPLRARKRIEHLVDYGSFEELDPNLRSVDTLGFVDSKPYAGRIKEFEEKTGEKDAVITGLATLRGHHVVLGAMEFLYIGGSMGSVVGERITRAIEKAAELKRPMIMVSTSGGARMQEGILSLMQMAKTSGALQRLREVRVPYVSILTDPVTAGVMASYASLGDIIIAEPGAMVGFAGPRVIEQTIREKLPEGFQSAQFVLDSGFIDLIVHRKELRDTLGRLLDMLLLK